MPQSRNRGALAESISQLEHRVAKLEERSSRSTNICELGAAAVEIVKPIPVSILCNGDDCIATFFDANVGASGETDQEAFDGLREVLVGTFLYLDSRPGSELSPEIQRQLDVLRQFMRRKP